MLTIHRPSLFQRSDSRDCESPTTLMRGRGVCLAITHALSNLRYLIFIRHCAPMQVLINLFCNLGRRFRINFLHDDDYDE